jgi:hypothetical protein
MVNPPASTRTHAKDAKGAVNRLDGIRRLTDDEIRVAISYHKEDPDNKYCAKVGVVILLVVNLIAFVTLFFHVANM